MIGILLVLMQTAQAECLWAGGSVRAQASGSTVTVNGRAFPVRGVQNAADFERELRACKADSAVPYLQDWREERRNAILTGVGGCFILVPWFWTPGQISRARRAKASMIAAIEGTPTP